MITKEEVKKIAGLARIKISESEEEKLQKDISSILDYVDALNEVDTAMVEPQSHAVDIRNEVRSDEVSGMGAEMKEQIAADIVKSAPDHDDGLIKVKAVF